MKHLLRNRSGQMVTEMILLMTVLLAITFTISSYFKNDEIFKKLVSGPWLNLSGMIQNGVWASPKDGMKNHPNHHRRHVSLKGMSAN